MASLYDWFISLRPEVRDPACVVVFALGYFFVVLLVRWHVLARFTRNRLQAELEMVRSNLRVKDWHDDPTDRGDEALVPGQMPTANDDKSPLREETVSAAQKRVILDTATNLLTEAEKISKGWPLLEILFWSRGQEPLGFSYVRDAGRLLWRLCNVDELNEHLEMLARELKQAGNSETSALAHRIETREYGNIASSRALLEESLIVHDERDIANLAFSIAWHNKAMWMTTVALSLTTALAITIPSPHPRLFIAGAIGGFLSRMLRMLKQSRGGKKMVAYGEGESWVTLFMSPLVGALAGWTGVLLIMVTNAGMALDPSSAGGRYQDFSQLSQSHYALGLAILLGFSERFFDRIVSKMDESSAAAPKSERSGA